MRYKAWVCSRLIVAIAGSNPAERIDIGSCIGFVVCCVVNVICDELIILSDVSYRVWVYVCVVCGVCVCVVCVDVWCVGVFGWVVGYV